MSRHTLLPIRPTSINRHVNLAPILCLLFLLVILILPGPSIQPGHAQAESQSWTLPENLSNSGAASQPRILAGPGEILQVFWIDRFDGLVTSVFDGNAWSTPQLAPIPADSTASTGPAQMPFLISDRSGWVHAFWTSAVPRQLIGGQSFVADSLYHSKLPTGGITWSTPEILAEDALSYSVFAPVNGGLTLAYIRRIQADGAPAGIYVRRLATGASSWEASTNVFSSIYYRLLTPGSANITTADDSAGNLFVIWNDPIQNRTLAAQSEDNGRQWSDPTIYSDPQSGDTTPSSLRLTAMPGTVLSIWQTLSINNCSLYQQEWQSIMTGDGSVSASPTETPTVTSTAASNVPLTLTPITTPTANSTEQDEPSLLENSSSQGWSSPEPIFPSLNNCPVGDSLVPDSDQQQIFWLWGQGTSSLSLSAWDISKKQWSIPLNQTFSFESPLGTGMIVLGDLHAALSNNRMAVVGYDASGEIWAVRSEKTIPDFIYAPEPAWDSAQSVTSGDQSVNEFTLAMDRSGRTHLVYTQPSNPTANGNSSLGASLIYTYAAGAANDAVDNNTTGLNQLQNHQVEIFPGNPAELTRQPTLLVDDALGFLHLVWSGQEQGDILYSRAPLDKADSPGEWFPSQTLSGASLASWPQIGMDATGRLYVLYSISFNEERGIYLTISEDHGQTWNLSKQIFDAAEAGLQGVERPTLFVAPSGALHAAWVETAPAGNGVPQGIFYAFSPDSGKTWSEPLVLAGPGNDWPKLAATGNQLHLIYVQSACPGCPQPQNGQLWERTLPLEGLETGVNSPAGINLWTTAIRLPGWSEVSLPFGITSDGSLEKGSLHLAGIDPENGSITYSSWQDGSWSSPESFSPGNTIALTSAAGLGLQAATKPEGETLAITWLSSDFSQQSRRDDPQPELFFNLRRIDPVELPAAPTAQPTATPTPIPAPTATIFLPTPTPDLNIVPPPNSTAQSPLILSAALVGLLVAGFFVWRLARSRRK